MTIRTDSQDRDHPRAALDAAGVRDAYRRWANVYDAVFGGVSAYGRRRAVAEVNRLPGTRVLEVGVGTGLALPRYRGDKRVVGVDLSREIANFLHDPGLDAMIAREEAGGGKDVALMAAVQRSWDGFGQGLRSGLLSYLLITARRRFGLPGLAEQNRRHLGVA